MNHLGVFGKYWRAGSVKTRLARTLGAATASELYRVFLATVLRRFATLGDQRWLAFTPAAEEQAFRDLTQGPELARGHWQLLAQSSGDLGERMQAYFDHVFAAGARRAVLIGSDSPSLPTHYVMEAFAQLKHRPAVLGPSADGGFYLIGAAGTMPPILKGIPWSTADVFECTAQHFAKTNTPCAHLPPWYDIDEPPHLAQLDRELRDFENLPDELRVLAAAVRSALADGEG